MGNWLKPEMIKWSIWCQPEDSSPREHFDDERDIELAEKAWNEGDAWGWGVVKVTGEIEGLKAHDYLGGCTYDDEAQFLKCDYYKDMQENVICELQKRIEKIIALYSFESEILTALDKITENEIGQSRNK